MNPNDPSTPAEPNATEPHQYVGVKTSWTCHSERGYAQINVASFARLTTDESTRAETLISALAMLFDRAGQR